MDTTLTKSEKTPNRKKDVAGRIFFLDAGGGRVSPQIPMVPTSSRSSRKAEDSGRPRGRQRGR